MAKSLPPPPLFSSRGNNFGKYHPIRTTIWVRVTIRIRTTIPGSVQAAESYKKLFVHGIIPIIELASFLLYGQLKKTISQSSITISALFYIPPRVSSGMALNNDLLPRGRLLKPFHFFFLLFTRAVKVK